MKDELAQEIASMANQEKRTTMHAMRFGNHNAQKIHESKHAKRMEEIITEHGWPTPTMVGEKGCYDAILIVQHAHDKEFKRHCLDLMQQALKKEHSPVLNECIKKLMTHLN